MCPSIPPEKVFWVETFKSWLLTPPQVFSSRIVTKVWAKESHSSADRLILIFFPVNCTCRKRIPSLASEIPLNHPGCFLLPARQKCYSWSGQAGKLARLQRPRGTSRAAGDAALAQPSPGTASRVATDAGRKALPSQAVASCPTVLRSPGKADGWVFK